MRPLTAVLRGERGGFAPAEFALAVGLWLFPLTILVVSLPTWVERQSLGRLAAQEAARAVAVAETFEQGVQRGGLLVEQLAANHGVPAADLSLRVEGSLERGQVVIATVTTRVPALTVPLIGVSPSVNLTSSHAEVVDQYRSFARPDPVAGP